MLKDGKSKPSEVQTNRGTDNRSRCHRDAKRLEGKIRAGLQRQKDSYQE